MLLKQYLHKLIQTEMEGMKDNFKIKSMIIYLVLIEMNFVIGLQMPAELGD
jgi:hypothetical protein